MLNKYKKFYLWLAILVFLIPATALLMRDLWFDEALTILNFALLPSPKDIYLNYAIPNNHIIYTGMLHSWLKIMPGFFPADIWLRLISFLSAIGIILLIFRRWEKFFGNTITLFCLTTLVLSPAFLTYSGAVRGYMTGALFTLLYLTAGLEYAASGKFKDYWPFGAFALLAVGIAPSNLAALTAVSFYLIFQCRIQQKRFWIIAVTPFLALLFFYAPIYKSIIKAWQLGEGWQNGCAASIVWFLNVIISFLPALLLALGGTLCAVFSTKTKLRFNSFKIPKKNSRNRRTIRRLRQLIWLLPLPAFLLPKIAPFPRVFLPLLPIYILLLAELLKHIIAYTKSYKKIRNYTFAFFLPAACYGVWINQIPVKTFCSNTFLTGSYGDDFFLPHYLRNSHSPRLTANFLTKYLTPSETGIIYSSFCADPWALMFYMKLNGSAAKITFDGPQGKIDYLPKDSLIIIRQDEQPEDMEKRFQHRLKLIYLNKNHKVYRCL